MMPGPWLAFLAGWSLRAASLSLGLAGAGRLRLALDGGLHPGHLAWLLPLAAALGALKARVAMRPALARNRRRLLPLKRAAIWRIFPAGLFALIATMILSVACLSAFVGSTLWGAAALGAIDGAVALALLLSAGQQAPAFALPAPEEALRTDP